LSVRVSLSAHASVSAMLKKLTQSGPIMLTQGNATNALMAGDVNRVARHAHAAKPTRNSDTVGAELLTQGTTTINRSWVMLAVQNRVSESIGARHANAAKITRNIKRVTTAKLLPGEHEQSAAVHSRERTSLRCPCQTCNQHLVAISPTPHDPRDRTT
jgi:hypothetical protein